jgi:adenylate cyclase
MNAGGRHRPRSERAEPGPWIPSQGLPRRVGPAERWARGIALALLVGLLIAGLNARGSFGSAEAASWAFRLTERARLAGAHAPVGPIAIVAIDDYTCAPDWHGCNPVPRADTAVVIDRLRAAGARIIALDQLFTVDRPGTDALANAMRRAGTVIVEGALGAQCSLNACVQALQWPIDPIARSAVDRGLANYDCATPAKLVETYALGCAFQGRWYPSLAVTLYRRLRHDPAAYAGASSLRLNYAGPPGQTYMQYSYRTLLESRECVARGQHVRCPGQVGPDLWDALHGKVVLIGRTDAGDAPDDLFADPLGGSRSVPGVEIQATALNTLLNHDPIVPLPGALAPLLVVTLALVGGAMATAFTIWTGVGMGVCLLVLYYALVFLALAAWNLQLPVVAPEVVAAAAFLLVLGARYTLEERGHRRARHLLRRFVAPAVADDLAMDAWRYAAGERRPIAVLFSDVRGFTTLSERAEPDVVMGALRAYFTRMVEIVLAHGGTVDKYIGDGMMALFGAPQDLPDPCAAALRAALAMQHALPELNAALAGPLGAELCIGVGINYGDAVFGLSGAPSKLEFTAIGDTVNIASRLESLCRDQRCGIVVSESVYNRLPHELHPVFRDLGVVQVKGRNAGIHVFGIEAGAALATATM